MHHAGGASPRNSPAFKQGTPCTCLAHSRSTHLLCVLRCCHLLEQATLEQAAQQQGRIDQLERMLRLGQQEVQQLEQQLQRAEAERLLAGPLR